MEDGGCGLLSISISRTSVVREMGMKRREGAGVFIFIFMYLDHRSFFDGPYSGR